jgi:ribulose-phosphate 3-epimerase
MAHIIAPSLLAADFTDLHNAVRLVDESQAQWLHLDVMDGLFVPNISFGPAIVKAIRPLTKKVFDTHLMIMDPDRYISAFKDAGADVLTVHVEACTHLHRTVQAIKATGMKAGVSLNPHTPIGSLEDIIADLDLVLIMSVNPGFGGQKFIENTYTKLDRLRDLIEQKGSNALIEVDGGVSAGNYRQLVDHGVDVLVAGNSVFGTNDPVAAILGMMG